MAENITPEGLNREELLQLGIQTARSGNKQGARVMFQQVLNQDPRSERALLWMAKLGRDKIEVRKYLTMTLRANPKNQTARDALLKMKHEDKARSNRALVYGGLFVGFLALLILVIVIVLVILPNL